MLSLSMVNSLVKASAQNGAPHCLLRAWNDHVFSFSGIVLTDVWVSPSTSSLLKKLMFVYLFGFQRGVAEMSRLFS